MLLYRLNFREKQISHGQRSMGSAIVTVLFLLYLVQVFSVSPAAALETNGLNVPKDAGCSYDKYWEPTKERLHKILAFHKTWLKGFSNKSPCEALKTTGRASLCRACLFNSDLSVFKNLNRADLREALLVGAQLKELSLEFTDFRDAILMGAHLEGAYLHNTDLRNATLSAAHLNGARLFDSKLQNADLSGADLTEAKIVGADIKNTRLSNATLKRTRYEPATAPSKGHLAGIEGLDVYFGKGRESGLVMLQKALRDAGLRGLEREATYALKSGRSRWAREEPDTPLEWLDGWLRLILFEKTTG